MRDEIPYEKVQFWWIVRLNEKHWGFKSIGGFCWGVSSKRDASGEGLYPCQNLFDFLDQNGAFRCILRTAFYRATHMQLTGIARYMLGSGVSLSVCHKAVFYQCSWAYHHVINRKLRWTLWWGVRSRGYVFPEFFYWKKNKIMHSDAFCAVILIYILQFHVYTCKVDAAWRRKLLKSGRARCYSVPPFPSCLILFLPSPSK